MFPRNRIYARADNPIHRPQYPSTWRWRPRTRFSRAPSHGYVDANYSVEAYSDGARHSISHFHRGHQTGYWPIPGWENRGRDSHATPHCPTNSDADAISNRSADAHYAG